MTEREDLKKLASHTISPGRGIHIDSIASRKTPLHMRKKPAWKMAVTGQVLIQYADSFQHKNRRFSLVTFTKTLIIIEFEISSVDWGTLFEEI